MKFLRSLLRQNSSALLPHGCRLETGTLPDTGRDAPDHHITRIFAPSDPVSRLRKGVLLIAGPPLAIDIVSSEFHAGAPIAPAIEAARAAITACTIRASSANFVTHGAGRLYLVRAGNIYRMFDNQNTIQQRSLALDAGDRIVLCSTALHKLVPGPEIARIVSWYSPDVACREIAAIARPRPATAFSLAIAATLLSDRSQQVLIPQIRKARSLT